MGKREEVVEGVRKWAREKGLRRFESMPERRVLSEGAAEVEHYLRTACPFPTAAPEHAVVVAELPRNEDHLKNCEEILDAFDEKMGSVMDSVDLRFGEPKRIRFRREDRVAIEASILVFSSHRIFWILVDERKKGL